MICSNCFGGDFKTIWEYPSPDKYEEYCGIKDPSRRWRRCLYCGHYQSECGYTQDALMKVYREGYRDKGFRGKSIKEQFDEIISLGGKSENSDRVQWVNDKRFFTCNRLLDIGSGLGVFPYAMKKEGWDVWATEVNRESVSFIRDGLNIKCFEGEPDSSHYCMFDTVSVIHVLEHIKSPELFLSNVRKYLSHDGVLFIEVPDALEFKYLSKNHDEFNSCHLHFFTIPSLTAITERSGFLIDRVERVHYPIRNLKRIRLLGRKFEIN